MGWEETGHLYVYLVSGRIWSVCVFVLRNGYCPFSNIYEVGVSYFIGLRLKAQPSYLISSANCTALKWGVKDKGTGGEEEVQKLQRQIRTRRSLLDQILSSLSDQVSTSCLASTDKYGQSQFHLFCKCGPGSSLPKSEGSSLAVRWRSPVQSEGYWQEDSEFAEPGSVLTCANHGSAMHEAKREVLSLSRHLWLLFLVSWHNNSCICASGASKV